MASFSKIQQDFPRVWSGGYVYYNCGKGWLPLLEELSKQLDSALTEEEFATTKILQIEARHGGLKLSMEILNASQGLRKRVEALVKEAEEKSLTICEDCGCTEGVTTQGNWRTTLCANCRDL